jgi:hypothetical protein
MTTDVRIAQAIGTIGCAAAAGTYFLPFKGISYSPIIYNQLYQLAINIYHYPLLNYT